MSSRTSSVKDPSASRRGDMFPKLSAEQVAIVARHATVKRFEAGARVFEQGEDDLPMYLVQEGTLDIFHPGDGTESLIVSHQAGEFSGELNLLSNTPSLVCGAVSQPSTFLVLDPTQFRLLVRTEPELGEVILRAFILRRVSLISKDQGDVTLLGSAQSRGTLALQEFLSRNGHPYVFIDVDHDQGVARLFEAYQLTDQDLPVVVVRARTVLRQPSVAQVARALSLSGALHAERVRDVVVVGAGPAGLAAAVYAASEGLDVLVLEALAPGGQAGTSSKIENYLGFPTGVSGQALTGRALTQAEKFGAQVAVGQRVRRLWCDEKPYQVELLDGEKVRTRSIIIATGAEYRKPDLTDRARFEGVGLYYGATFVEAQRCGREEVIIVGGGNSAGQAAVFLARHAAHVHLLVRGPGLAASMSSYLINRIEDSPHITLRTRTSLEALEGQRHLEQVTWRSDGQASERRPIRHVFLMTGASPNSAFLHGCLELDSQGFVKTGAELSDEALARWRWLEQRRPQLLETSLPGVFAVGDVRSASVKRVASAVGEGSICVSLVHQYLAAQRDETAAG